MNMISLNNKIIFKKIESRNKLNNNLYLKKNREKISKLNTFYSPTNKRKNFILSKNDKSTNTDRDNTITNNIFSKNNKVNFFKINTFEGIKFPNSVDESHKLANFTMKEEKEKKIIKEFNKNIFRKNILIKNKEGSKISELQKNFEVRNFILMKPKIIQFSNLNKNNKKNNFLLIGKEKPKLKKNLTFLEKRKIFRRNVSFSPINRFKKIEDIYPTVFNIEGGKNFKLLDQIQTEGKKSKKKVMANNLVRKNITEMKKYMTKERDKIEKKNYKNNISDLTYKRKLLMATLEFFKKDLNHLRRKNSFKFNIQLPLYNLFLNLDY